MASLKDVIAVVDRLPGIAHELEASNDPKARDAAAQILTVWRCARDRIGALHAQHVDAGRHDE